MNSKLIYTCLIISIVLMLSGCQNNTNELTYRNTKKEVTEVTNENKTNVVDKTVNIKKMKFTEKQKEEAASVKSSMSFAKSCKEIDGLYNNSEYIVEGEVENTFFTVLYGEPYTVMELKVNEKFKGSVNTNDKITVLLYGGYMTVEQLVENVGDEKFKELSVEERKNKLIEKKTTDSEYPNVGDKYILFLMDSNLVENAYDPVNDYECIFKSEGKDYIRNFPEDEKIAKYSTQNVIKNNVSLSSAELEKYCITMNK